MKNTSKQFKLIMIESMKYYSKIYGLQGQQHRITVVNSEDERATHITEDNGFWNSYQALGDLLESEYDLDSNSYRDVEELTEILIVIDPKITNRKKDLKEQLTQYGIRVVAH